VSATTIGALVADTARRWPGSRLIVGDDRETYAELDERASRWARRLLAAGVGPGDHVGILLDAALDYVELMVGIARLGATIVPISERFKAAELRHIVVHADLRAVITTDRTAEHVDFPYLLRRAFPALDGQGSELRINAAPFLRRLVLIGDQAQPGFTTLRELDELASTVSDGRVEELAAAVGIEQPAFLMYTSGTSAEPKACVLTHEAFTRQGAAIAHTRYFLTAEDTFWCPLPLFHNGGICTLLACLTSGASFCHSGRFEPGRAIRQLERERCTHGIPTFEAIWLPVLDHPDLPAADLSALRAIVHSGSPERLRQLQARLPTARIISNYGCTEAAGHFSMTLPDEPMEVRATTCGKPLPGMEVRIVDPETGRTPGAGELGEIRFRGPMRFTEYYKSPELTAAAFDEDGWYRSGDRGALDAEGRVIYAGRLKDMLKVGGENVSAVEVEAFLLGHPAVRIAAVVGAPDAKYDEVPAAFVELRPGTSATEQELVEFCIDEIATFKVPRYVRFVEEWPMSGTKIQKFVLRERLANELRDAGITQAPPVR
jgi:fatty-acyl-CoA synthase